MSNNNSILIVEDEKAIRTGLVDVFIYHGFSVDYAEDGEQGLEKALTGNYQLIILDVMMPKMNGFDVCKHIREKDKQQPIIMLTAKTTDDDIILGLSLGADDYVAKPFSVAQLVLRVQAVLRRTQPLEDDCELIELDDERMIDLQNLTIADDQKTQSFTKREIEVIGYLNRHPQRPVSREELLTEVWGYHPDLDIETRTVDIHIAKIRKKIEKNAKQPQFLITVRGAGYKLVCQQPSSSKVNHSAD